MSILAPILLVFGPTASGKTALAVDLAKRFDAEIINADSMQLYQGLPILTALPNEQERDGISHHLFGTVSADDHWSVGTWLHGAKSLIADIRKRGKRAILVGGTGLYFEALTKGLAQIPDISQEIVTEVSQLAAQNGTIYLREQLEKIDPKAAARIQGADQQRLIRALSVYRQTGKTLTSFQQNTFPILQEDDWIGIVLQPEREPLYERINTRFEQMIEQGALREVTKFLANWQNTKTPLHKAIGLASLEKYIANELSLEAAIAEAQRNSRRYAKRQMTWARGRAKSWQTFSNPQHIADYLQSKQRESSQ